MQDGMAFKHKVLILQQICKGHSKFNAVESCCDSR